jgi:hypothetical protein
MYLAPSSRLILPVPNAVAPPTPARTLPRYLPAQLDLEALLVFGLCGLAFGMVARMQLLRWRRGYAVGAVLAALVVVAIVAGALTRHAELAGRDPAELPPGLWNVNLLLLIALAAAATWAGASIVFGVWSGLVHLLLPARRARALLDWQTGRSDAAAALARP